MASEPSADCACCKRPCGGPQPRARPLLPISVGCVANSCSSGAIASSGGGSDHGLASGASTRADERASSETSPTMWSRLG
eukprot:7329226-Prymnesium_polylepis.1